jgi:hypothetical protein
VEHAGYTEGAIESGESRRCRGAGGYGP